MLKDRYDNPITTSSHPACNAYVAGSDLLLSASAGTEAAFRRAIAADEGFALAHIALARTLQIQGRGSEVKAPLARARELLGGTTDREKSHIAIFGKILEGQGAAALEDIRQHIKFWPRDAMALAPATSVFGLIGFSGKAGREADQLAILESLTQHYGDDWWFRTVLAFAQIELQKHEPGRRNIEHALAIFPRNAHAAHIRAHLYYEQGERTAGLAYLSDWARTYPKDGQIHCHVNWHIALWAMETGDIGKAWQIYREQLHPGGSWGPQINVLTDCASFLFRAELAGQPRQPELWRELSRYASQWFPNSGIAFVDTHSALAHAMAGDGAMLARLTEAPKGPAADTVSPVARGFAAFARQDWDGTIAAIEPILATHERLGGSRAQRDLVEYTMTVALLRTGRTEDAQRFISVRRPQNATGGFPLAGL